MLGAAVITREAGHLRMDALHHLAPPRLRRALDLFADVVSFAVVTYVLLQSVDMIRMLTRTAQRTNDTMRVLTLASVILLPSVVLAGVMGMNFKVGVFENPNLFWVVIGAMLAMAAATLAVARWRRWL